MKNWVLPNVLTVEDVLNIDAPILELLSKTSTGIVLKYVNNFISANESSSDETMRAAAIKLRDAYYMVNKKEEYLNSDEAKKLADTLVSLQYSDITFETDLTELETYKMLIIDLLSEDDSFRDSYLNGEGNIENKGFKTSYTDKLDELNLVQVCDCIMQYAQNNESSSITCESLVNTLKKNKNLFKNSNRKVNRHTVLRKAIYQKDKLLNILKGIDFIIEKKVNNESPRSWRRI